jgi:hypothetical protein
MGAPPGGQRVGAAPHLVAVAELEQVVEGVTGPALGEAQDATRLEQPVVGQSRRYVIGEAARGERTLGRLDVGRLDERLDQDTQRQRDPRAGCRVR